MCKITIVVIMGGDSAEKEISKMSGKEIVKNLDTEKYRVIPFEIKSKRNLAELISLGVDVAFIALHGPGGEDGTMQGCLELLKIPYTGSGVLASAIGMDKIYSRNIFTQKGINVPKTVILYKKDKPSMIFKSLKYPLFIKPANQGSSVGTSKAKNKKDLDKALKIAFSFSDHILVEEYIEGTEITCAILGNNEAVALPLIEIVPKKEFFDLEAKYDASLTDEICPARINKSLTKKAQEAALAAYKAIGCRGFGRVDMIIKGNKIYVLEVNTIPGLTSVSLFPKAAKTAGISYPQLLDEVVNLALNP
ncbi:MAG TPA: D-alanine--D-alanine ligase [Candidatus Saccharimonadales bacterium]|nr:D-alanine--D-alanine ligase [Candidatus Saccharimonadales bacterium]